jgi:hypothetical protein
VWQREDEKLVFYLVRERLHLGTATPRQIKDKFFV